MARSSASIAVRLLLGGAAVILLTANITVPANGRLLWVETNPRPLTFDGGCHPLQFTAKRLDGGAWTGGALLVDVATDGGQVQLLDSTCQQPVTQVVTTSAGQGAVNIKPVNGSGFTFDSVSIAEADMGSPWPYPVQYGTSAPTRLDLGGQWMATTNSCASAYVAHTDTLGSPRFPVQTSTDVTLSVSPSSGDLVIYADPLCTMPAPFTLNGSAKQYILASFGPYARFAFEGATSQQYAVTVQSTALSGQTTRQLTIFNSLTLVPTYAIFESGPQTVPAGQCSGLGTISAHDQTDALSESDGTFTVSFDAPTHMTFFEDDTCTTALPVQNGRHQLTFPAFASTASFAFRTTVTGQHQVSLTPGNAPASLQTETIIPASVTPSLHADVSATAAFTCSPVQVTLRNAGPDGGTISYPEYVKVCVNDLSSAQITLSSLSGGDGGTGRCTEGTFSTTADVKIKSTVPTEATITVTSPRSTLQLPKVTWSAGPPVPKRSALSINGAQSALLAPAQTAKAQLVLKDQCSGLADVTGHSVAFEGGSALQFGPVSIQNSVATANVTLTTCEGVGSEGVPVRALIDGVVAEDGTGAAQEVFVQGDCALPEPLVSVTLSASASSAAFGSKLSLSADIVPLTTVPKTLRLRLTGTGAEFAGADGARSATRDVTLSLAPGTNRISVEASLTGNGGSTATIVATPIDELARRAGEPASTEVEITPLPAVDLGCSAGAGGPLLLLALCALLSRTVRRVG